MSPSVAVCVPVYAVVKSIVTVSPLTTDLLAAASVTLESVTLRFVLLLSTGVGVSLNTEATVILSITIVLAVIAPVRSACDGASCNV